MFCTSDFAGQVCGKGFRAAELPERLVSGIGWTPTNLMLTAFGPIADSPWGPFGPLLGPRGGASPVLWYTIYQGI